MFVAYHERYRRKGELDHDLTDEELDRLRPVRLRNAR
jgi:hypothetical protein